MKRPCAGPRPGTRCPTGALVAGRPRCDACRRAKQQHRNLTRPPGERQFYGSAVWRRLAASVVAAAEGVCAGCGATDRPLTAGHRLAIRQRPDLALVPENVRAECRSCQRLATVTTARRGAEL